MVAIADRVKDDYLANSILREKFRKAKKESVNEAHSMARSSIINSEHCISSPLRVRMR